MSYQSNNSLDEKGLQENGGRKKSLQKKQDASTVKKKPDPVLTESLEVSRDLTEYTKKRLEEEKKKLTAASPDFQQVQVSRDLIGDKMEWLEEEEKKAEARPEKEQVQVSRDLTEDAKKRLEEEKKKQKILQSTWMPKDQLQHAAAVSGIV
jgi:hypothetical protein